MSESTDTTVLVMLLARSKCPLCGRKIEIQNTLSEESLITGNTTQQASYWAKSMRAQVQGALISRGWTGEMCGQCRDKDPEERDKDARFRSQMTQLKELGRTPLPGAAPEEK